MRVRRLVIGGLALVGLCGCQTPEERLAQVSMTPMKPHATPAAMQTVGEGIPTPEVAPP